MTRLARLGIGTKARYPEPHEQRAHCARHLGGEIRWYTFAAPDERRPVLVLTRDAVIDALDELIVVPATRTVRGIGTEVLLTTDDGVPATCALIARLDPARWQEAERALLVACGFAEPTTSDRQTTVLASARVAVHRNLIPRFAPQPRLKQERIAGFVASAPESSQTAWCSTRPP
jgi:mRNA interferase MazF